MIRNLCGFFLCLVGRDIGASYDACANSPARRLDHASRFRLRPRSDASERPVRGKNRHPPSPPRGATRSIRCGCSLYAGVGQGYYTQGYYTEPHYSRYNHYVNVTGQTGMRCGPTTRVALGTLAAMVGMTMRRATAFVVRQGP